MGRQAGWSGTPEAIHAVLVHFMHMLIVKIAKCVIRALLVGHSSRVSFQLCICTIETDNDVGCLRS